MIRIRNLVIMNRVIKYSLVILVVIVSLLLFLDYSDLFYSIFKNAENMQLKSWTSVLGSMIAVLGSVGINTFFHNKNEIIKINESFLSKWNNLDIIKYIYLSSTYEDFIDKSNSDTYIIKYDMEKCSISDFYNYFEEFDELCSLLACVDKKSFQNCVRFMSLGKAKNSEYLSLHLETEQILLVEYSIELINIPIPNTILKSGKEIFENLNSDDIFIIAVNKFIKAVIKKSDTKYNEINISKDVELSIDEYLINGIRKKLKLNKQVSVEEIDELRDLQIEIIYNIQTWSTKFNADLRLELKKFKEFKNYGDLVVYYEVLYLYKYAVENKVLIFADEKKINEKYNVEIYNNKWGLNSAKCDTLISIDRKFIENIICIHDKIQKLF